MGIMTRRGQEEGKGPVQEAEKGCSEGQAVSRDKAPRRTLAMESGAQRPQVRKRCKVSDA